MPDLTESATPGQRHAYSAFQLSAYYERIELPAAHRHEPGSASSEAARDVERGLVFLTALQRHHLASIPFENLDLHYNKNHAIHIDPPHVFQKIVETGRGRGGYCHESNGLFGVVLRSLGFDVYPTAARINSAIQPGNDGRSRQYSGWGHMVHIVSFGPKRYEVDVGNGPWGPTSPLALDESSANPVENTAPQLRRLRRSLIQDTVRQTAPEQLLWCYEVQHDPRKDTSWIPVYCFGDVEFLPSDFETLNFYSSQSPKSWFRSGVCATKHILRDGKTVGTVACFGRHLTQREHGETVFSLEFKSEEERTNALEEHLGITLTPDEKAAISRQPSEIISQ